MPRMPSSTAPHTDTLHTDGSNEKTANKGAASGYTELNGATKVPTAKLGGAGADATKYLRGDQTWAVPSGGGGAPLGAPYVTTAADPDLTNEKVLGTDVIIRGLAASKPAAGTAGRIYIETDGSFIVWRDNGATWDEIARGEAGLRLAQLAEKTHASLTSVTADQHHAQSHTDTQHTDGANEKTANKGVASGYASLDASALVPDAQIPAGITRDSEHGGFTPTGHHAQAHAIDGADHTLAASVAGRFLRATGAATFAVEVVPFSVGATVLSPSGAINVIVWRASFPCTVTNVRGYRVGGTGATINARRNGTLNHLASDLSLTSADIWMDGGAVQNTAYAAGDKLEIMLVSLTGSPTQIGVQIDYTRP